MSKEEALRLFDSIDKTKTNRILENQFIESSRQWSWLRNLIKIYCTCSKFTYVVPSNYDYSKTTNDNYKYDKMEFFGPFAAIRSKRDYSYHVNYTPERQLWQDVAIKSCVGKTEPQARPWIIFSCGPMVQRNLYIYNVYIIYVVLTIPCLL